MVFGEKLLKRYENYNFSQKEFSTAEINIFGAEQTGGGNLPSSDVIDRRRKKVPDCINTLSKDGKLVGYYVLYPLNKTAVTKILKGELYNAKFLELQDIIDAYEHADGLYIGMLVGTNTIAKALIATYMMQDIAKKIDNHKTRYLFAKAGTAKGHKVIKENNFTPIENSQIQFLDLQGLVL
jgi:hypothetical protein